MFIGPLCPPLRPQGHLITLFSATNYCGTANNAGAILVLGRDLVRAARCGPGRPSPAAWHLALPWAAAVE